MSRARNLWVALLIASAVGLVGFLLTAPHTVGCYFSGPGTANAACPGLHLVWHGVFRDLLVLVAAVVVGLTIRALRHRVRGRRR